MEQPAPVGCRPPKYLQNAWRTEHSSSRGHPLYNDRTVWRLLLDPSFWPFCGRFGAKLLRLVLVD